MVIAVFSPQETSMHSKGCHIILKGILSFASVKDYIKILA